MKKRSLVGAILGAVTLTLAGSTASAQIVTTLAGSGAVGSVDGNGQQASFSTPTGLAVDRQGNVYVADTVSRKIRKVTPDGAVTTIAGDGKPGYQDGNGTQAEFFGPLSVAADASGNVWVADTDDGFGDGQFLKKITPDGVVHNLSLYPGSDPIALAVDDYESLYVSDSYAGLWKIPAGGEATLLADGISASGLAVDGTGNVYVADGKHDRILKIAFSGAVTVLAGSGSSGDADGQGSAALFCSPSGLTVDSSGNVYVADNCNNKIRKITPSGFVTTLAGSGSAGSTDGMGPAASFRSPRGVAIDSLGELYVADSGNDKIRGIVVPGAKIQALSGVIDLSVRSDGTTRLLRFDPDKRQMSLDTLDENGSPTSGQLFGPYPGWLPRAVSSGLDGLTRVLWNNGDGSAGLWLMGTEGNTASQLLGAISGLRATDVALSGLVTDVLWSGTDGRIAISSVDRSGQVSTGPTYGPYPGWVAVAASDGPDGKTRVLWNNVDGRAGISLAQGGSLLASYRYGPVAGWTALDVAVGGDGLARILWSADDQRIGLWIVDSAGKVATHGPVYAAPAFMSATRIAAGPDGSTRVLFADGLGGGTVWLLSPAGVFEESFVLKGPSTSQSGSAGAWAGTFSSDNEEFCVFTGIPAAATFQQIGSAVRGILNAPTAPCFALESRAFSGILQGNTFYGSDGGSGYVKGTLSGTTLEIELGINSYGYAGEGQLHLHR